MTTVLIMAGGTGGHVYPALTVASALRARGVEVFWLGTRSGLEARVVPAQGMIIEWLDVKGLIGTTWRRKLAMPWMLIRAVFQALAVIRRRMPDVVLGMGGFAAGPGGIAARLTRRPLVIHEANAVSGLTNRLLAPLAQRVLAGFEDVSRLGPGTLWTGNPVRPDIVAVAMPAERGLAQAQQIRLLVLGGSQGAQIINEALPSALQRAAHGAMLQVTHQSGAGRDDSVRKAYRQAGIQATVIAFIDDMAGAYSSADLVIARAGAMTVSELCAVGLPAILLPYPHAAGDHQSANAMFLARAGCAVVISAADLDSIHLATEIDRLVQDRVLLRQMAERSRALARPDATERVVKQCLELTDA